MSNKVLIVENKAAVAETHAQLLEQQGCQAKAISNPMDLTPALGSFSPNVIVIDLQLDRCNVPMLLGVVRKRKEFSETPIVYLSENDNQRKLRKIWRDDDVILVKPVEDTSLIETVKKRIGNQQQTEGSQTQVKKEVKTESKPRVINFEKLPRGTEIKGSDQKKYTIQNKIGVGAVGSVYRAICNSEDRKEYAIKFILLSKINDTNIKRFELEAKVTFNFDHKNLLRGYDYCKTKQVHYLIMELIDGKSIEKILLRERHMDPVDATNYMLGIASGLEHLDAKNMLHRDIKPANIVIHKDNTPKLVDFGVVKERDSGMVLTAKYVAVGTPDYIAPEQLKKEKLDIRCDIYALGGTFYHMVVGKHPFDGRNMVQMVQQRMSSCPDPRKHKKDLPKPVSNIIQKMMQPNKEKRHNDATELIEDLKDVLKKIS